MEGPLEPVPAPGKEDSEYRRGLLVATNTTRTQVWTARNAWDDTTTTAARAAGLAWGADSGLTWDQKYAAWIDSLAFIPSADGYSQTVELTTPWGKRLPSPSLECAEMSMFPRITFAAWHELPWFMESATSTGTRVYFGHNGVRTASGRYAQSPEFGVAYADHSRLTPAQWMASWPVDANLRTRKLGGGTDTQPAFDGAPFGRYLDEIHLNKRVGYFTVMALSYLGSMNLADTANTYNLVPEAVRAGDMLVERWQRSGIGHTLVVKEVLPIGEGNLDVVTISGSMPRRQGKRESGVAPRATSRAPTPAAPASTPTATVRQAGWRREALARDQERRRLLDQHLDARRRGGVDQLHRLRPHRRPPGALRSSSSARSRPSSSARELLAQIEDARRRHLRNYPASCAARQRRENAFAELYALSSRTWGTTQAELDRLHRKDEDYVLAELTYGKSKTCCWNSTTSAMYEIIMAEAAAERAAAAAAGTCAPPTVFMSHGGGYARWAARAQAMGQAAAWRAWSEDESCPQRAVAQDEVAPVEVTPYCERTSGGGGACTDAYEANDSRAAARAIAAGTHADLRICAADRDWFSTSTARTVRITFSHAAGDLDLAAYDASGARVATSQGTGDSEQVTVPAGGTFEVYGYNGATGGYTLTVQ
ncbi:MAG: hypothetical protein HS111_21685 [Kofleriaceae bacterium]|nr:hypothetical protein [Kofleriaceae bacterium]